ncbi:3-hydroxyacyl-[acyl-carrier-protein] dehydratase [Chitinivorax tropicus]|uniref:3-hydroxyacyl-[acyl-carrier-protein] dehydratase FabZ n=1 Tax=Chitinivorax tropicus TaxID=714531 RepID=A0A840MR29_9PROT|nr:3-hydroxyacyl-ACP dehydratase FabZ [Chitinivorax tropicus]MBB5019557.1 3-hydroxyacyl-[acyl-carrier-protein] dehydratase [Chitinivorax tropicus]
MSSMDINQIMKALPHRYPFLLVDRVLECEPGKKVIALKNVTINEPFFTGHFPELPVMPGVLIIEAMAQAAGLLAYQTVGEERQRNTIYYFAGIDNARFKVPVSAGDQLIFEVELVRQARGIWKFTAKAKVGDQLAAEADIMVAGREVC